MIAADAARTSATPAARSISALELALGAAVVIGHNVFHVLPNEVPILVVLALVSMRIRNGGIAALGFRRPESWMRVVAIALAAATLRIALGYFAIDPLTALVWPPAIAPEGVESIAGDWRTALMYLGIVWTFAAFGEEIAYRGYLMNRAADAGGRTTAAWWISVVVVAVLFGYGHYYKGPAGIVDSGVAGLILGAAYLVSGRVLWTTVLAHGFIDTFGVGALYFGFDI
jgi:membrane protease YdiL (CAAX protease family)